MQPDQQPATLKDPKNALGFGENFIWRSVKFRAVGVVLEWIPVDSPPGGDYQRCTQRGSPSGCHCHFQCPTSLDHRTPPPPPPRTVGAPEAGGGAGNTATVLANLASRWAPTSSVDEPGTLDESAILSWCPCTRAQYVSRLRARSLRGANMPAFCR